MPSVAPHRPICPTKPEKQHAQLTSSQREANTASQIPMETGSPEGATHTHKLPMLRSTSLTCQQAVLLNWTLHAPLT